MGKKRIIAETGAGQHGVATAAVCAKFGFECVIYMGAVDMERQALNVFRMRLMGAEVRGVEAGQKTLKEAINEAMRDWVTNVRTTHYILGTVYGAHPYPMMVRDFHRVIGREAKAQILAREGRLPDELVACVGGGSNAMGLFYDFLGDPGVKMTGVEAGGRSLEPGEHAARFATGRLGVLQGCKTLLLQDAEGQIEPTHSISAGLDYAAVGPEHLYYRDQGRIDFTSASDDEVLAAFQLCARLEGIIPALESSHALVEGLKRARALPGDKIVLVNLSGRGDKDVQQVQRLLDERGQVTESEGGRPPSLSVADPFLVQSTLPLAIARLERREAILAGVVGGDGDAEVGELGRRVLEAAPPVEDGVVVDQVGLPRVALHAAIEHGQVVVRRDQARILHPDVGDQRIDAGQGRLDRARREQRGEGARHPGGLGLPPAPAGRAQAIS